MKTDKESGAIRLMEALSAASEELLERSEKAGRAEPGGKKAGIILFVQKYAKACAACLCLAVLGAAYFGISQMRMGSAGDANTKNAGSGDGYSGAAQMGEWCRKKLGIRHRRRFRIRPRARAGRNLQNLFLRSRSGWI